jgi:hypothetical protein
MDRSFVFFVFEELINLTFAHSELHARIHHSNETNKNEDGYGESGCSFSCKNHGRSNVFL